MANEGNLIPTTMRSKEEARENSRKGGIASGKARRKRKALREELEMLLAMNGNQEKISIALIRKAAEGDVPAYKLIAEMLNEYQAQQKIDIDIPDINIVRAKK